jgi:outer membrane immunogenic protein
MRVVSIAALVAAPVFTFAHIASAADMPVKAPAAPAPAFSWTGCYGGVNGGWIGSRNRYALSPAGNYVNAPGGTAPPNAAGSGDFPATIASLAHGYSSDDSSGLAGVQIGCNRQYGSVVLGVEADWQWTGLKTTADAGYAAYADLGNPAFTVAPHSEHVSSSLQWFSTLRGRVGYAFDKVLVYGTGGLAIGRIKSETTVAFAPIGVSNTVYSGALHTFSDSTTKIGWTIGAGVEYAFLPNWSVKGEYLYVDFGSNSYLSPLVAAAAPFAPGYAWATTAHEREHIARVGVSYKFY